MATTAAEVKSPPSDALWVCVSAHQLEIQELGKFAVMEQNKKHHWELTFNTVYEAWKMTLAANYGNLFLLHLTALKNGVLVNYQAVVWVQAEGYCGPEPKTLVSFKELVL